MPAQGTSLASCAGPPDTAEHKFSLDSGGVGNHPDDVIGGTQHKLGKRAFQIQDPSDPLDLPGPAACPHLLNIFAISLTN